MTLVPDYQGVYTSSGDGFIAFVLWVLVVLLAFLIARWIKIQVVRGHAWAVRRGRRTEK